MMYIPKKFKFKKQQKGKNFNIINTNITPLYEKKGFLGLRAEEAGRVSSKEFKSLKMSITKIIKKSGRIIFNTFPQTPITKKPIEVRMGKGKGNVDFWAAKIKMGLILCRIECNSLILGIKALKYAKIRLSIKTTIINNK